MFFKTKTGVRIEKIDQNSSFDGYQIPNYHCKKCGLRMYQEFEDCPNCKSKNIDLRTDESMRYYRNFAKIFMLFFNFLFLVYILIEII